jgi:hypothetical protein
LHVEKRAVKILRKGYMIITKNGPVKSKTLRSDKMGLYVFEKDVLSEKGWPRSIYFECDTCHKIFRGSDDAKDHVKETGHKKFHMV